MVVTCGGAGVARAPARTNRRCAAFEVFLRKVGQARRVSSDVNTGPRIEPRTVADFHAAARDRLDEVYYDFYAGGARDEITLRSNENALEKLRLLPRILSGSDKREHRTTLLGTDLSMPILLSPTAFHRLAHPDGEFATARAAAAAGTVMIVSNAATSAIEDIAAAAPTATLWFQLYLQPEPRITDALVRRAEDAGARALVVTVDSPVFGRRERDDRHNFHDLPPGMHAENMRGLTGDPDQVRPIGMSAEFSWADVDRLRSITALPVLLKGVLHPADAVLAVGHGVAGLLVSNHGGRGDPADHGRWHPARHRRGEGAGAGRDRRRHRPGAAVGAGGGRRGRGAGGAGTAAGRVRRRAGVVRGRVPT
jgi:4-hydroxymandelate oxidase